MPSAAPFFPEDIRENAAGDRAEVDTYEVITSVVIKKTAFTDAKLTLQAGFDRLMDQPWQEQRQQSHTHLPFSLYENLRIYLAHQINDILFQSCITSFANKNTPSTVSITTGDYTFTPRKGLSFDLQV